MPSTATTEKSQKKEVADSHPARSPKVLYGANVGNRICWPEWATLGIYAGLLAVAIYHHEPFSDEAQAWQLAHNLPLVTLFRTYLRYEGSPGLWHLLLWILSKAQITYNGMHWFSGVIAFCAMAMLVISSPFPRYLRLVLPFTYFFIFQYAVVARSYVLVPLLLFMLAWCWRNSPLWVALVLGLLANTSLHAAAISGGFALIVVIERIRLAPVRSQYSRRTFLIAAALFLILYVFAIWTAWPPGDLVLSRVRGDSRPFALFAFISVVQGVYEPWFLSVVFWVALASCLRARRSLLYLLPVCFFAAFSGAVTAAFWHVGLLVPTVLCLLWITSPAQAVISSKPEKYCRAALAWLAATQIVWAGYALTWDYRRPYSPDIATAQFLRPYVERHARIAVTYIDEGRQIRAYTAVGILPYFDRSIFINQTLPFWSWKEGNPVESRFLAVLPAHPELVVVEKRDPEPGASPETKRSRVNLLIRSGYRLTNTFCGTYPERLQPGETTCHLIFQFAGDRR